MKIALYYSFAILVNAVAAIWPIGTEYQVKGLDISCRPQYTIHIVTSFW